MNKLETEMSIQAGAAMVDVSPPSLTRGAIWMAGYMPLRFALRQADPITARAIALGNSQSGLLLATVDTCLISPKTAAQWAKLISSEIPLPTGNIIIATTHTHSGPDLSGLFGGIPKWYTEQIVSGVIAAARLAWANRRPSECFAGTSTHKLGIPRRIAQGQTETDDELVALQWRSGGETVATLINLGCHGVVYPRTSKSLSSDLPGALCRGADSAFGGVSLFVPRAQGDVNPDVPGMDRYEQWGNSHELARLAASGTASIAGAVKNSVPVQASPITINSCHVDVKMKTVFAHLLFNNPLWNGRAPNFTDKISVHFKRLRIGGIEAIAVPGEILTCLGKEILSTMTAPALLLSYSNGYYGYMMTPQSDSLGGYESKMSIGPVEFGR